MPLPKKSVFRKLPIAGRYRSRKAQLLHAKQVLVSAKRAGRLGSFVYGELVRQFNILLEQFKKGKRKTLVRKNLRSGFNEDVFTVEIRPNMVTLYITTYKSERPKYRFRGGIYHILQYGQGVTAGQTN